MKSEGIHGDASGAYHLLLAGHITDNQKDGGHVAWAQDNAYDAPDMWGMATSKW
jgi:hypothetical protein